MRKVLVIGKGGQLGTELQQLAPSGVQVLVLGFPELDITDASAVEEIFVVHKPDLVINAAAYTAVDKAETDKDLAYAVNKNGAEYLAAACAKYNARFLHVSTDFVFDGKACVPYQVDAKPNPVCVYGASKLAGDIAVQAILPNAVIVRTAWVYSCHANNFVKSMLKLMKSVPQLNVVNDQVGTPTWTRGLGQWLWSVAQKPEVSGVYHWTDAGVASWYDFAVAIQELALDKGLLEAAIPILPIPTSGYPLPAKRPSYSVLDKSAAESVAGMATIHWRKQLSSMLDELILE